MADSSRVKPDFGAELAVEAHIGRVPDDVTCKGIFFQDILEMARALETYEGIEQIVDRRYVPFMDYPLVDHMRLTAGLVPLLFPGVSTREGMRRLGWRAYPTFAASLLGRLARGLMRLNADSVLDVATRSIEISLSRGQVQTYRCGSHEYRLTFTDIYGYLDSYYVGVVEGALRYYGVEPEVEIALSSPSDGVFWVSWTSHSGGDTE